MLCMMSACCMHLLTLHIIISLTPAQAQLAQIQLELLAIGGKGAVGPYSNASMQSPSFQSVQV